MGFFLHCRGHVFAWFRSEASRLPRSVGVVQRRHRGRAAVHKHVQEGFPVSEPVRGWGCDQLPGEHLHGGPGSRLGCRCRFSHEQQPRVRAEESRARHVQDLPQVPRRPPPLLPQVEGEARGPRQLCHLLRCQRDLRAGAQEPVELPLAGPALLQAPHRHLQQLDAHQDRQASRRPLSARASSRQEACRAADEPDQHDAGQVAAVRGDPHGVGRHDAAPQHRAALDGEAQGLCRGRGPEPQVPRPPRHGQLHEGAPARGGGAQDDDPQVPQRRGHHHPPPRPRPGVGNGVEEEPDGHLPHPHGPRLDLGGLLPPRPRRENHRGVLEGELRVHDQLRVVHRHPLQARPHARRVQRAPPAAAAHGRDHPRARCAAVRRQDDGRAPPRRRHVLPELPRPHRRRSHVRGGVAGGRVLALLGGGAAPRGADGAAQRARDQPARARPERLPPQRPQGLRQRLQVERGPGDQRRGGGGRRGRELGGRLALSRRHHACAERRAAALGGALHRPVCRTLRRALQRRR
mmetsp:Transcript_59769/g.140807  ORF Transcript_59769/g.140807 Transcript_59769/m.140807 type:complete len:518 (-) Transcript_59769:1926-3479(-)